MRPLLALIIVLAGCDRVFGINEVPTPGAVTGSYVFRFPQNDATGATMIRESAPAPGQVSATVRLGDQRVDVAFAADGTFSVPIEDVEKPYWVTFRTPWNEVEYQLTVPTLDIVDRISGRPDRILPLPNTQLQLGFSGAGSAGAL